MNIQKIMSSLEAKHPGESEYLQAVKEVLLSIEDIYNQIVKSRHVYFHANQILMLTKMIFSKSEADAILSDVFELIDSVSAKIL